MIIESKKGGKGLYDSFTYQKEGCMYEEIYEDDFDYRKYYWWIFPDGTCIQGLERFNDYEDYVVDREGTYDGSRYEEFASQMETLNMDWEKELYLKDWYKF